MIIEGENVSPISYRLQKEKMLVPCHTGYGRTEFQSHVIQVMEGQNVSPMSYRLQKDRMSDPLLITTSGGYGQT